MKLSDTLKIRRLVEKVLTGHEVDQPQLLDAKRALDRELELHRRRRERLARSKQPHECGCW